MKLREYEYMLAIAQEANMTRAAQRLYISQPALSKLLASVESELGVQLFLQENRRMIPTAAGKIWKMPKRFCPSITTWNALSVWPPPRASLRSPTR